MLKTIRGEDGTPYINLEDLMNEVLESKEELEGKLFGLDDNDDTDYEDDENFSSDNIEDRIDFLDKLYNSLKTIQQEYYKKMLGMK